MCECTCAQPISAQEQTITPQGNGSHLRHIVPDRLVQHEANASPVSWDERNSLPDDFSQIVPDLGSMGKITTACFRSPFRLIPVLAQKLF
jgi:hypothetical protein